jgi:hypothetical protein
VSTSQLLIDQGPIYEWIKQNIFGGDKSDVWIYNCAAYWRKKHPVKTGYVRFVCRARCKLDKSTVYVSHIVTWTTSNDYVLQSPPVKLNIPTLSINQIEDVGPQDPRVFGMEDSDWIIFNMLNKNNDRQMFVAKLDNDPIAIALTIVGHQPKRVEKNWTPLVPLVPSKSVVGFIYSFDPLCVLTCPDINVGECHVVFGEIGELNGIGLYRGGTPAIEVTPGVFAGFLHSTVPLSPLAVSTFSPDELPIPAKKTSVVYHTHNFVLNVQTKSSTIGSPISIFSKQIELVYGWNGSNDCIVNVNDKSSVIVKF